MFDIGANLTHRALRPRYHELLDCARRASISDISITAAHPDSTRLALTMIEAADSPIDNHIETPIALSTTTGLHPHLAAQYDERMGRRMRAYAAHPEVAAIGETGLDYFRMLAPAGEQQACFRAHLRLAADLGKPVFLHQREAHQDFISILRDYRANLVGVVVHCFTDNGEALRDYLELDCSIGVTGWICDAKRGEQLRKLVAEIPDERLMIETDAPYLLPPEVKDKAWLETLPPESAELTRILGRNNLPHNLPLVLKKVAECRGQSEEAVAAFTTANARVFFGGCHLREESRAPLN